MQPIAGIAGSVQRAQQRQRREGEADTDGAPRCGSWAITTWE
jgi:hypothetical protein